jgi:hypothetical protein
MVFEGLRGFILEGSFFVWVCKRELYNWLDSEWHIVIHKMKFSKKFRAN